MKRFKVVSFFLIFMCCAVAVLAVKTKDIPPWMEDIEDSSRGSYLVPKGSKRKAVGSQIIVEPPSEYVARRIYEIEKRLEKRFATIEDNQSFLYEKFEEFRKSIHKLEKRDHSVQDLTEIKRVIKELNEFKRLTEEAKLREEFVEEPDESGETAEDPEGIVEEERR